jgi:hypothetical protein
MAAATAALAWLAGSAGDILLMRYPGATRLFGEKVEIQLAEDRKIERWAVYLTPVELSTVEQWYRRLLRVPLDSPVRSVKNCIWLNNSQALARDWHIARVMLCRGPKGTSISVYAGVLLGKEQFS